jgi:hypothetical protein
LLRRGPYLQGETGSCHQTWHGSSRLCPPAASDSQQVRVQTRWPRTRAQRTRTTRRSRYSRRTSETRRSNSTAPRELAEHERRTPTQHHEHLARLTQGLRVSASDVPAALAFAPTLAVSGAGLKPRRPKLVPDVLAHPPARTFSLPAAALTLPASEYSAAADIEEAARTLVLARLLNTGAPEEYAVKAAASEQPATLWPVPVTRTPTNSGFRVASRPRARRSVKDTAPMPEQ